MLDTDLACEILQHHAAAMPGVQVHTQTTHRVTVQTTHIITPHAARESGKPVGVYYNLDTTHARPRYIVQTLATLFGNLLPAGKILVVGIGNENFVADSLGPQVLQQIEIGTMVAFAPKVFGVTGISSTAAIKVICDLVRPTAVVVIDSLVSHDPTRIGTNFQITTAGLTPGSGVGRDNQTIDQKLLGVPVVAVGVPVCTILKQKRTLYHVVPKDIDLIVADCASIIAKALNSRPTPRSYGVTKP